MIMRLSFKYKALLFISPAVLLLDYITKTLVRSHMEPGERFSIINGYFDIVNFTNMGAAFGAFAESHESFRVPFFYVISLAAAIVIVFMIVRSPAQDRIMPVAFSLILAGIGGNILDRIRFGAVTDFLSIHIKDKFVDFFIFRHNFNFSLEWPAFNVADCAISASMVILIYTMVRSPDRARTRERKRVNK